MPKISGDLIALAKSGYFDIIAHGANCFCTMGAGIAKKISQEFPQAFEADLKTKRGDRAKLGQLSFAKITLEDSGKTLLVANLYTQYFWGRVKPPQETQTHRYTAISQALRELSKIAPPDARIGLPRLGAGLAGGDWEKIEEIIAQRLPSATIVELPQHISKLQKSHPFKKTPEK